MVGVSYTSINGTYIIARCRLEDIDTDILEVKRQLLLIDESVQDEVGYREAMEEAVLQDSAKCVYKDGTKIGFMYIRSVGNVHAACSIAMLVSDRVGLVLLMLQSRLGKYKQVRVYPHGSNIRLFRSMLDKRSMFYYNNGVFPYVLMVYGKHKLSTYKKLLKLYKVKKVVV